MKKHSTLLVSLLISFSFLIIMTGCGKVEEVQPEAQTEETVTEKASTEETTEESSQDDLTIIGDRVEKDGQMQSYLTGEWKDTDIVNRRPIAVMVPNNAPALPQYGLSLASIIYEAPVEGRITRLMPIFEDFDELDKIGPVRSSRDYYIYTALGYEAIYCNWGLARPYVEELINRDTVNNISAAVEGIYNPSDEAFGRVNRGSDYALEFTGYLFIDGLLDAVDRQGYRWDYDDAYVPQFTFAADDCRSEQKDAEDATIIRPGGTTSNAGGYGVYNPYFEYNEDDQLYYRFQDGNKQIDEYNGDQLSVSNVVFQYCHGEVRDDHDYLAFGVHGEGDCIIFTNGKAIKGKWYRYDGDNTPAKYYDEDNNEIVVNQGKTWICNIWEEYGEFAEYE